MKQFFTLALLVIISLSAEAQVGTVYRLQGTLGGNVTAVTNGTAADGFRRSSIWKVVNADGSLGANQSPTSGATLQIFGINLEVTSTMNLSAFDFTIQIRSEYRDFGGTGGTIRLHRGRLHVNDVTLTLGSNSSITLGWGMYSTTSPTVTYFLPGFLRLQDQSAIFIGTTTVADRRSASNGDSYLNANAYNVTATSGTNFDNATSNNTSNSGTITVIPTGTQPPTANITNKMIARPGGALFTNFALFYNAASGAGGTAAAPLPVQLINFNAAKATGKVVLTWTTAQEINSDYFDVQRSTDATNWKSVAIVKAAGNSGTIRNYHTEDAGSFTGNVYYRIKMVDKDATHANSNIARLSFAASNGKIFAYPNPASNYTVINSDQALSGKIQVEVINSVSGVRMLQQVFTNPGNSFRLNMNQLPAGNYVVNVYSEQALLQAIKIAKY
jgi:hypothetical protein